MSVELFKRLATREQYEYLRNLDYQPCNLPNVGVHYGELGRYVLKRSLLRM